MFKRLTLAFLLFALLFAMGGQWAVLQSIAWTTMLADNIRTASLPEAVAKTFDGKHACRLCKAVAAGKNSEQKKEFISVTLKLEFPPVGETVFLITPMPSHPFPQQNSFSEPLAQKPALPPPRSFFV
jgi:hypothetical protein